MFTQLLTYMEHILESAQFNQKPVTLIAIFFALKDNKKWLKPT